MDGCCPARSKGSLSGCKHSNGATRRRQDRAADRVRGAEPARIACRVCPGTISGQLASYCRTGPVIVALVGQEDEVVTDGHAAARRCPPSPSSIPVAPPALEFRGDDAL